jgi:hypothetical protein
MTHWYKVPQGFNIILKITDMKKAILMSKEKAGDPGHLSLETSEHLKLGLSK